MARGGEADELKRKREDYAVQLRKKQREEMFKAKRTTLSDQSSAVTGGAGAG
jgi:Importin beta binding domain